MRVLVFTFLFSVFTPTVQAAEATASLIAELVGLEQELRDTRWTFDTRDQEKALEEKAKLVRRILGTVADYEAVLLECGPIVAQGPQPGVGQAVVVRVPRTISNAEIALIERIVRLDDEIDRGDWGFSNRDEKKALEEEKKRAKETLGSISRGLCGDSRVVTILPR